MLLALLLGMMVSSPFWGTIADKFGRRGVLATSSFFLFYFGLLTAFAPSFGWILCLRFLVGFYIGGMPQACTLFVEYLPSNIRGQAVLFLSFFWALGSVFEALLARVVMPELGWRYLVAFSTLPLFAFVVAAKWLPESPMYLSVIGKHEEVDREMKRMARINGKPEVTAGVLVIDSTVSSGPRGRFLDLFVSGRAKLTVFVFVLWFVAASTYYGVVLLSTELLNSSGGVCLANGESPIDGVPGEIECSVHTCKGLKEKDYVELIWTTLAEFPGTILAMVLIDRIGRKSTLAVLAALFAVSTACVAECAMSKTLLIVALFGARGCSAGFFQTVYVYTAEVFPTRFRAVALGSGSCSARIGAMLTPYIAQVLLKASLYSAVGVYAALGVLASIVACLLPIETAGSDLTKGEESGNGSKNGNLVEEMEENEKH